MLRNGYSDQSQCSASSGWMKAMASFAGGIGIGAGLLYLLDPDKGVKRRQQLMEGASGLASSAGETLGHVGSAMGSALSSAREYAGEKLGMASDYAADKMSNAGDYAHQGMGLAQRFAMSGRNRARDFIQRQTFGETRSEHRLGVTICALGSLAMGAALMYALDPTMGRSRRRYVREKAGNLASQAGDYARQAGEAIRHGIDQAKGQVSSMTGGTDTTTTTRPVSPSQPSAAAY